MPSRIITAASTGGTNANKKHGEYVSFDTIVSDTGPVSNAHVTSATLYISSYQVWINTAWLTVIFGNNSGSIVANTQLLHKNSESHSSTETLDNLNPALLTASVSQMRLGVLNQNTSSTNTCVNVRNGCTITLTINYEYNHKTVKYYNGSNWVECVPHYYNGSKWAQCDPYYYDGSGWKECNGS